MGEVTEKDAELKEVKDAAVVRAAEIDGLKEAKTAAPPAQDKELTEKDTELKEVKDAAVVLAAEIDGLKKELEKKDSELREAKAAARPAQESPLLADIMLDVSDFVKAIQMEGRGLEKVASDWIRNEDGKCLKDVVNFLPTAEFIDALPLKRISRVKAASYLEALQTSGNQANVGDESSLYSHALDSLGLVHADLHFVPFDAHVDVADAPAGSPFRDVVEELFLDGGSNRKYRPTGLRVFCNTFLQKAFDAQFNKLCIRRGDLNTPFHQHFNVRTPKGRLLRRFCHRFGPAFSRCCRANWLPVWQGTSKNAAEAVCKSGFASLARLNSGYFCRGIYNSPDPGYACRYGLGEFGGDMGADGVGCVILSLLCIGLVYPIDRGSDYAPDAPANASSSLLGKPLKTSDGYDAHIAAVEEPHFQAASDPLQAPYLEVVVEQESQLLPIAILEYKRVEDQSMAKRVCNKPKGRLPLT